MTGNNSNCSRLGTKSTISNVSIVLACWCLLGSVFVLSETIPSSQRTSPLPNWTEERQQLFELVLLQFLFYNGGQEPLAAAAGTMKMMLRPQLRNPAKMKSQPDALEEEVNGKRLKTMGHQAMILP